MSNLSLTNNQQQHEHSPTTNLTINTDLNSSSPSSVSSSSRNSSSSSSSDLETSFQSHSVNCLSTASKIRRNLSHRRKLAKKLPLIKKELESESNFKQSTERLIQSIIDCNLANLKQSLESGANVNTKYNNWSLLHYACSMIEPANLGTDRHLEIVRLLLEYGAQVNSQDEDRWTPLHLACQQGITRVIS